MMQAHTAHIDTEYRKIDVLKRLSVEDEDKNVMWDRSSSSTAAAVAV